jgi:UDP-glucose 4-epimerase
MKILITGGAGYIGYSVVRHLLKSYNQVSDIVVYDNLDRKNYAFFTHEKFSAKYVHFVQGDLLDYRKLKQALKDTTVVFHLAGKVTTPFADSMAHAYDQINHWGTAHLTDAIEESEVQTVVNVSSVSVYGATHELVDEDTPPHPQSFYGISKLAGEKHLSRLISPTRKVYTLRSGNIYGYNPCMRFDAVINRFMFEANFRRRITIDGSGDQTRAFIHVDKLAEVMKGLLGSDAPSGTYNVVEHNYAINDVVEAVRTIYPDLETISVNFDMPMRSIAVQTPCKIFDYVPITGRNLLDELNDFKLNFAF